MPTIRAYQPADLVACRELWVELTVHHRRIYGVDTIGGDDPGSQFDEHLAAVGTDRIWVAVDDGKVVGLAGLIVDGTQGEIEPVVVTENRRGQGIGADLVERVMTESRHAGIRMLSARPVGRNEGAIRFFRDAGLGVLGHVELFADLSGEREWVDGETIAGREFRV